MSKATESSPQKQPLLSNATSDTVSKKSHSQSSMGKTADFKTPPVLSWNYFFKAHSNASFD